MKRPIIIFFLGLLYAQLTYARQVGFQGAYSIISENTPQMNDLLIHYTPHHRFSLGLRHIRMEKDNDDIYAGIAQTALLVKRWNKKDLQANLYAYGGAGGLSFQDKYGASYLAGGQIDAEDRRLYGFFRFTSLISNKIDNYYDYRGRLGAAPYIADYKELNTWVMLQYDYRPNSRYRHRVTPFVRLFYKNILLELGSSTRGEWMINFITEI